MRWEGSSTWPQWTYQSSKQRTQQVPVYRKQSHSPSLQKLPKNYLAPNKRTCITDQRPPCSCSTCGRNSIAGWEVSNPACRRKTLREQDSHKIRKFISTSEKALQATPWCGLRHKCPTGYEMSWFLWGLPKQKMFYLLLQKYAHETLKVLRISNCLKVVTIVSNSQSASSF